MTDEDLIESTSAPISGWRRRVDQLLRRPAVAAALLVVGLLVGSAAGYVVGHSNPRVLSGIYGYSTAWESFTPLAGSPFDQTYGRPPIPMLTPDDLAALGEVVTRQFSVLSARSAIPVLCGTPTGQPGSTSAATDAPSTVFSVQGGEVTELVWMHPDANAASGALRTLVFQAWQCSDIPEFGIRVTTSGLRYGIGDEYAFFYREPLNTVSDATLPVAMDAIVVLVRVGSDLIEIAMSAAEPAGVNEGRCYAVAEVAVRNALGG
ncbi:MAG: hypothetical protein M3492_09830 [Actinomycetota bacterium]|nr:hypothetical protein [Actinomycetota bacterium]